MLVGEAPGREEFRLGRPFVGKSGEEQERYLSRYSKGAISAKQFYCTNICKEYIEGNPTPTQSEIEYWTPALLEELAACRPRLVIAVGKVAAQWFLGNEAAGTIIDMAVVHGMPQKPYPLVATQLPRDCVILPIYHPALGFYNFEARSLIAWDYEQVVNYVRAIKFNTPIQFIVDEYEGVEDYEDIAGTQVQDTIEIEVTGVLSSSRKIRSNDSPLYIAIDTEGTPGYEWSIQYSFAPGTGYLLCRSQPDFDIGVGALQSFINSYNPVVVLHDASTPSGCAYDMRMCRAMGLELRDSLIFNTMYFAYLLRLESHGLKALSQRWCGMAMADYESIIGDIAKSKQIRYLENVITITSSWPKPEQQLIHENDGTMRLYQPQGISRRAISILKDVDANKLDKDGNPPNIYKRWRDIDKSLRRGIESPQLLGRFPVATLGDIEPERATYYACRDADATGRIYLYALDMIEQSKHSADYQLAELAQDGNLIMPIFDEMQSSGIPASRRLFRQLSNDMFRDMQELQSQISHKYYDGRPFNPNSTRDVSTLMRREGLQGTKRTPSGGISTAKTSIEHHRYTNEAIRWVFEWREAAHIKDAFCTPVLEAEDDEADSESDLVTVYGNVKPITIPTRRLAMAKFKSDTTIAAPCQNLLAIPARTAIGKRVRDCYVAPEGMLFGGADLSQIEARVAADQSQDPLLLKFFIEGLDIHKETAAMIFGVTVDEVSKAQRDPAKTANYGIFFGQSAYGLLTQLQMMGATGWTESSCERIIASILKAYPGLSRYMTGVRAQAASDGLVRDRWGMKRYLPAIYADEPRVVAEAGRHAVSHCIQGGAQGMLQKAMIWLRPIIRGLQLAGLNVQWVLQVHDELIFLFDEELEELIRDIVLEGMTEHCGIVLRVPVLANWHSAKSWGGLK